MPGKVYLLHLFPALDGGNGQVARHYTGSTKETRFRQRMTDHALGRGARMLQVQLERGGKWLVAKTEPGGLEREYQLKNTGGASRRCPVCKAEKDLAAGKLTKEQALAKAGYDNASGYDRSILLEIFGVEPDKAPEPKPAPAIELKEDPKPAVTTPEVNALVDELIAGWAKETPDREKEMEMEA